MIEVGGFYLLIYAAASALERWIPSRKIRSFSVCGLLGAWIFLLLTVGAALPPWFRLLSSCVGTLWLLKLLFRATRTGATKHTKARALSDELLFRFIWPGMCDEPLRDRQPPAVADGALFVRGYLTLLLGCGLLLGVALTSPYIPDLYTGFIGLFPLFLMVHLGYAAILTALLRLSNRPVPQLFQAPLSSSTLQEFWSRRWNLPFVEMNRVIFFKPLCSWFGARVAILFTFVISGLFHELGISYPAGSGYGSPTAYFLLHGLLVLIESLSGRTIERIPRPVRQIWVWISILGPLPLLFPPGFRSTLVVPLYQALSEYVTRYSASEYLNLLLLCAGLGHFLVLVAGIQVPYQLGWRDDLAKLRPFNRKIMWNYGFFIFSLIIAFGVETLLFRDAMVAGVPAALGFAWLIAGFWLLRLLVDYFYFEHSDWPEGPTFVVGHALLNSLFTFLVFAYTTVIIWHW
jgi:alginate O-acetyltransferase complex protein AlgI